jgi:hypothetical protein
VSTTRPTPRHGTRARYRLEIKKGADGKPGIACDRCKAANAKAAAAARASRAANSRRARMHIVDGDTRSDTAADTPEAPSLSDSEYVPGPMEEAIVADLDDLPADLKIAMHRSLRKLVVETARDYDRAEGIPSARAAASKQLEVLITKLRTKREGDGDSALDILLSEAGFGSGPPSVPDVPDRPAKTRNTP